ncbi:MAG: hypothetical protein LBS12_06115 [Prevotellaceae bacterium]|jgi:hypothetical protein|nr:hypothetical protein [Prevotellaceae bacterium]
MSSTSETGHVINIANLKRLTVVVTGFGTAYAPSAEKLKVAALATLHTKATNAVATLEGLNPPLLNAIDARQVAFEPLEKRATRILFVVQTIPLNATVIKAVKELVRKIHGGRATPKRLLRPVEGATPSVVLSTPPDASYEADVAAFPAAPVAVAPFPVADTPLPVADPLPPLHRYISVSQRSFDQQIEHTSQLIAILDAEADYQPAETDLTVAALNTMLTAMRNTNNAAVAADVSVTAARAIRNEVLYAARTGLVDVALDVKRYVHGAFGSSSREYAMLKGIDFRKIKKLN